MTQSKAVVATVKFGSREVEGLMLPDGSFGIAAVQANELLEFSAHHNYVSRSLKTLLGKDFPPITIATELNSNKAVVLTLVQLETLIRKLDRAGNKKAQELSDDLIGLGLTQLFSDAFGIKYETEERSNYFKYREVHRLDFHTKLTAWLKLDKPDRKDYGHQVNKFKLYAGVYTEPVDGYSSEDLKKLTDAYTIYDAFRRAGFTHEDALKGI
jgi:hypothetical protein